MTPEEIAKLWEGVDKSKLLQYKLKVDMNSDVINIMNTGGETSGGAAPGPGL